MSDLIKLQSIASTRSLLYIDGDKTTQRSYSVHFKKAFKNFYQAFDGEEGLALFEKHKPDVVILNLELDKKDAVELISEITDINKNVIIVAITQECKNYDLLQTLDMGLAKTLLKPVEFTQIAHLLISLLPSTPSKPKPATEQVENRLETKKMETPKKVVAKPRVKTDLELCLDLIKQLQQKQTLIEFINSYKGVMVLHSGVIEKVQGNSFYVKVNIAQALAAKSEKQILIKTIDNKYIHAQLLGVNLKTTTLEFVNPRILQYKQRGKEYSRIMADKSFKASIYYNKKHIDFAASYISFHSVVLFTQDKDIDIKVGAITDITLGFDISGPNAIIKDKKFTKVFAKCEVIRVEEKKDGYQIVVLLNVSKAGERTLKKYLTDLESEITYEFQSRAIR